MIFGPDFPRSPDPLRENLFQLFQRSYAQAAKHGKGLAVYRSSAALLAGLSAEGWAQHTLFPAESALVRRFLAEARLPAQDPLAVVARSLLLHCWAATWRRAMQEFPREAFLPLCRVEGAELLRAALAGGRGVVLVHHHALFAPLFWSWLEHEGIAPGVTIGHWAWEQERRGNRDRADPRQWVPEVARELTEAVASLRAGGLAHVFGDGLQGKREIALPFCGRLRGFRPSFAELAGTTGAPALTVTVRLAPPEEIRILIGPALDPGAAADSRARSEALVRAFAARLEAAWREDPAQLPWGDMRSHLALPAP